MEKTSSARTANSVTWRTRWRKKRDCTRIDLTRRHQLRGTKWGKRSFMAVRMCTAMSSNTHPTPLIRMSGDTHERMNSPASLESVSPTSSSMVGVSVDWNFTKQ